MQQQPCIHYYVHSLPTLLNNKEKGSLSVTLPFIAPLLPQKLTPFWVFILQNIILDPMAALTNGITEPPLIQRHDLQNAIAKAVELRALHAALIQRNAGGTTAIADSSSLFKGSNKYTVPEDYPVFTPSCDEDAVPRHQYLHSEYQSLPQTWSPSAVEEEGTYDDAPMTNKGHVSMMQTVPEVNTDHSSTLRSASENCKILTAYNKCKLPTVSGEFEDDIIKIKDVASRLQALDPYKPLQQHSKQRGLIFSRLLPKSKKKLKPEMPLNTLESDNMSQLLKEWGVFSLELMKKKILEANKSRDAALAETAEMQSSMGELRQKLVSLEAYCEELKKALKQATNKKSSLVLDKPNQTKRSKLAGSIKEMPVSHEVMVEGFLQIVSEARLSVKQFCKTIIHHTVEIGGEMMEGLNFLLQPYQVTVTNGYSKGALYHLEALVNQSLYQDFENCVFQKNGSPKFLDPRQECWNNFSAFVALRNLSWNEVLRKGTKYCSEDFCRFSDQKMSSLVSLLNCCTPWPEQILHCFFVAAKCIWLLHLLAFSFSPPLMILRVEENQKFDSIYMEETPLGRRANQTPERVAIMVMPGFYVQDKVLKCRVLCRHTIT